MLDVIIALIPLVIIAFVAFGMRSLTITAASLAGAIISDLIFSWVLLGKKESLRDGSAIITGLLLALTLSPLTPWYIALFGGATAVVFGKILWGGMGRNRFNPALVGREFMTVFFASVMNGSDIWKTKDLVMQPAFSFFDKFLFPSIAQTADKAIYNPVGALGEYSALALILAALFLIIRKRISWQIPAGILVTIILAQWFLPNSEAIKYSVGGILLGTLFMATDLPTSPSNNSARLFYGIFIGIAVIILIQGNISFAYMSYAILILNGFSRKISETFRSSDKHKIDFSKKAEHIVLLSLQIICVTLAVLTLDQYGYIQYLVYFYIVYSLYQFYQHKQKQTIKNL